MSPSQIGLLTGAILGLVIVFGGPLQALLVVVLALAGLIIGRIVEGNLDVRDIFGGKDRP